MTVTKSTTLKQVAQAAQCSVAVASKVLNHAKGNVSVSLETSKRVRGIAEQMGYRPNLLARSLVSRSTRTIGLYVWREGPFSGFSQGYESAMIAGIDEVTQQQGYDMMLLNSASEKSLDNCIEKCRQGRFDGLILLRTPEDPKWLKQVANFMPNLVAINTLCQVPGIDVATFDHQAATRMAIEHLVQLGHRKIGFIGNTRPEEQIVLHRDIGLQQRQIGFEKAIKDMGLPQDERWVFDTRWVEHTPEPGEDFLNTEGRMAVKWMESLDDQPTALIGGIFRSALGAIEEWRDMKLHVPTQRSIVGLGDRDWCAYFNPGLTTIDNALPQIGHWAADQIINRIEKNITDDHGHHQVFSPHLILRQSTAAPCKL